MINQASILKSAPQRISTGRLPFWLRQKSLISVSAHTLRPGGLTLTRRAVELCDFTPKDRILDVGCGYGMTLKYLKEYHDILGTGIDPDFGIIRRSKSKLGIDIPVLQGAMPSLPFLPGTWNGIFCECALSLAQSPSNWLSECCRLLAHNGKLVLTDLYIRKWTSPDSTPHPRGQAINACATGARTLMEMMSDIEAAGLKIDLIEDHTAMVRQLGMPCRDSKIGYCMIIAGKYK